MKAFKQINLHYERRMVWGYVSLLILVCFFIVLTPVVAADLTPVSNKPFIGKQQLNFLDGSNSGQTPWKEAGQPRKILSDFSGLRDSYVNDIWPTGDSFTAETILPDCRDSGLINNSSANLDPCIQKSAAEFQLFQQRLCKEILSFQEEQLERYLSRMSHSSYIYRIIQNPEPEKQNPPVTTHKKEM